ncbi:MAG: extracellular solute-binding protein [Cyanobacteria bacterium HKST-UBA03]|nr:extracellular solute-binding protein [Cyanobacteria bacterium HKST-UBA03]
MRTAPMATRRSHRAGYWLAWLLAVVGFMAPISGCTVNPARQEADGIIELEFWSLQMLSFKDYMTAMIADYETAHPNIRIKWVDVPFSEGEKKAISSMLAQHAPDVVNLNPNFSALLAQRGALIDFRDYLSEAELSAYVPVTLQAASQYNGQKETLFGLPWYVTSAITIYNDALLPAGVGGPPRDYPAMARLAKQVHEQGKGYLLMPTLANGGQFFKVLFQAGVPLVDETTGRFVFADHGAGQALAFWVALFKSGVIPRESLVEGHQAAVDRYQSGTLGLLLTGANFLNMVRENAPAVFQTTRVAPQFPEGGKGVDFSEMILVVPKRSAHPKEAVAFARFVTNAENTRRLTQLAPVLSPNKVVLQLQAREHPALPTQAGSDDHAPEPLPPVIIEASQLSARQLLGAQATMPVLPRQNELNQRMDYFVQQALLERLTPEAAMAQAQAAMNGLQ